MRPPIRAAGLSLLVVWLGALAPVGPAEAATERTRVFPYDSQATQTNRRRDLLLLTDASAVAAAANRATGVVEVNAAVTDTAPAGTNVQGNNVGATDATTSARVIARFQARTAGSYRITVTYQVDPVSFATAQTTAPQVHGYREAFSQVHATFGAFFASCGPLIPCTSWQASGAGFVAASSTSEVATTVTVTGDMIIDGLLWYDQYATLTVEAGLLAAASVQGSGSASLRGKATVTSIKVEAIGEDSNLL